MAARKGERVHAVSELHLLRHAKAAPQEDGGDRERSLDPSGRRAAQALAAWAAGRRLAPELVLCSPALRTRQTLDIVAPALVRSPHILIEDSLYLANARQLLARLRKVAAGVASVIVVGHNPGLHELATILSDVSDGALPARLAAGFPAGALASFEVPVAWPALDRRRARLAGIVTPKELIRGIE
ncbi:MAG TPA: histidine phosphatase family protein [Stellaceae bacterium]